MAGKARVIRAPEAKLGSIIAAGILVFLVSLAAGVGISVVAGAIAFIVTAGAAVALLSRVFRTSTEDDGPREWWRLTGRPTAGYVIAAVLFAEIVSVLLPSLEETPMRTVVVALYSVLAAGYLHSSIRLTLQERAGRAAEARSVDDS